MNTPHNDRIGSTDKEQLRWVLSVLAKPRPLSEGDRLNLRSELQLFSRTATPASHEPDVPFGAWEDFVLEVFRKAIDATVRHVRFTGWPPPPSPTATVWNQQTHRVVEETDDHKSGIATNARRRLKALLLSHGHLLKLCQAPAKMRAGRKAKDAAPVSDT